MHSEIPSYTSLSLSKLPTTIPMAASPSSSRPSPLSRSPLFTPIPELDKEEEEGEEEEVQISESEPEKEKTPTPLPQQESPATKKANSRQLSVLCTNCRPSPRDKSTSVVPLDRTRTYETTPTNPKTILHSLILTLTRTRSPRPTPAASSAGPTEEEYRLAAEELASKLARANRKRDEALLEASRLRRRVSDLERRLGSVGPADDDPFPAAAEDARASVRELSRSILVHITPNRIASVLRMPVHDTNALLIYVEALLNRAFYNDFEKVDADEAKILNPATRCERSRANYKVIRQLTWEHVLHKGTKHYNQGFSKFCDEKMSEIIGMLGWARAWPESLLQSFFEAAKSAWIVHLLGRCVYPGVTVMRVERGAEFDGEYMEQVVACGKRGAAVVPVSVRMVVAPGFYLCLGGRCAVVKCLVVCDMKKNSD